MSNGYRYIGTGERFRGVPARDLTQAEYDALGPREQRSVVESGAYALIVPEQAISMSMSRADLEARAREAGIADHDIKAANNKGEVIALIEGATVAPEPEAPAEDQPEPEHATEVPGPADADQGEEGDS